MPEASARPLKLKAEHVSTCLSCYWGGHSTAHLQVPVRKNMTLEDLKAELRWELMDGCFGGSDERTVEGHPDFEAFHAAACVAVEEITTKEEGALLFTDLEERAEDDDGEEVYAFFLFLEVDGE